MPALSFMANEIVPPDHLLVEEITHRVFNEYTEAIASISLAAAGMASAEGRAVLFNVAGKLRSYANAHRALQPPIGSGAMDLGDYLGDLCAAMSAATLSGHRLRLALPAERVALAPDRCWRIGLIIAELITNAARHGLRTGEITVAMTILRGEVLCCVMSEGAFSPASKPGRGQKVVDGLALELGGRIERWFGADRGYVLLAAPISTARILSFAV